MLPLEGNGRKGKIGSSTLFFQTSSEIPPEKVFRIDFDKFVQRSGFDPSLAIVEKRFNNKPICQGPFSKKIL